MAIFQQEEQSKTQETAEEAERMVDATPLSAGDPIVAAAVASVMYSWYQFYINNDSQTAMFVGLWAPTLLTAASYLQEKDLIRRLKQGFSSI